MSTYRACLAHYLKGRNQKQLYSPQEGFTVLEKALVASASMEGQPISGLRFVIEAGVEVVNGDDEMEDGTRTIDHMLKEALASYNAFEFSVIMTKRPAPEAKLSIHLDRERSMGPQYEDRAFLIDVYDKKEAIKVSIFDEITVQVEPESSKEAEAPLLPPVANPLLIIAKVVKKKRVAPEVLTMAQRREAEAKAVETRQARLDSKAAQSLLDLESIVGAESMEIGDDVVIESVKQVDPSAEQIPDYESDSDQ